MSRLSPPFRRIHELRAIVSACSDPNDPQPPPPNTRQMWLSLATVFRKGPAGDLKYADLQHRRAPMPLLAMLLSCSTT